MNPEKNEILIADFLDTEIKKTYIMFLLLFYEIEKDTETKNQLIKDILLFDIDFYLELCLKIKNKNLDDLMEHPKVTDISKKVKKLKEENNEISFKEAIEKFQLLSEEEVNKQVFDFFYSLKEKYPEKINSDIRVIERQKFTYPAFFELQKQGKDYFSNF